MWLLFLIPACVAAVLSCLRLITVAAAAGSLSERNGPAPSGPIGIGLYETAYLAGGPERVVDLALVLMAARQRLHLAHTGWTTVVDPRGRSRLERALISGIGPDGQCRTSDLRRSFAGHPTVLEIGGRLAVAGLATPSAVREVTMSAVRQVRHALLMALLLMGCGLALGTSDAGQSATAMAWFALPVILTSGTLLMARVDVYPYTRWAAPAGQEVLQAVRSPAGPRLSEGSSESVEQQMFTAVAIVGPAAVLDPRLRQALRPNRRRAV